MPSTATSIVDGLSTSVAVKAPCRVAATTDITLEGLQVISGIQLVEDDRVLVTGQSDAKENGIYAASTGQWQRTQDADGNRDLRKGTRVLVESGGDGIGYELVTDNPIVIGTSELVFELREIDSALRTDLASTTASSDGSRLSGYRREESGSVASTVYAALAREVYFEDFGGVGDDSTDSYAAIQRCIELAESDGHRVKCQGGIYRISQTLKFLEEGAVDFGGTGALEHYGSVDPQYFEQTTVIRKTGNFTGIEVGSSDPNKAPMPHLHGFTLDATSDDTGGIGIDVIHTRGNFTIRNVCVQDQGSHGIVLRKGNLGTYQDLKCMLNGGDGFLITGATPVPDTNACVFLNLDLRGNTGWGMNMDVGWANFGVGITTQSNVAGGVRLNNARQNKLEIYSEANTGPEVEFIDTADCKGNHIILLEGFATFNGTTANRNTVLNMKRGSEFDPNYSKITANRFILPNLQNDNTGASPVSVAGVLEIKHTTGGVYEFAHAGSDADVRSTFTHDNGSFKHRLDADALLLRKAASTAGTGEVSFGSTVQTTVGAAGAATALPANPTGYLIINVAGTARVIPYYAAS